MGLVKSKLVDDFPENLSVTPPSAHGCRGPGLLDELDLKARDVLPKCFEGAELKVRKKYSEKFSLGYNVVFSAVTPSGGQLAGEYRDKRTNMELCMAPSGATALQGRLLLGAAAALELDTQLYLKKSSVGTLTLQYSKRRTTLAVSLSGCTVPLKVLHHEADILEKANIQSDALLTLGVQAVRRLGAFWVVGAHWSAGQGLRVGARRTLWRGNCGALVDRRHCQAFWWRRVDPRLELGALLRGCWSKGSEEDQLNKEGAVLAVGARWERGGTRVQASCATDGLVACTLRRTVFLTEEAHCALLLSALLNHNNNKFRLGMGFEVFI